MNADKLKMKVRKALNATRSKQANKSVAGGVVAASAPIN